MIVHVLTMYHVRIPASVPFRFEPRPWCCVAGREEQRERENTFLGDFLFDSRCGERHDHDITQNRKGNESSHDSLGTFVAEHLCEEQGGHVLRAIKLYIFRHGA